MEQLTLFGGHFKERRRSSKRALKNQKTSKDSHKRWDLWSQEPETEKELALFFLDIRNFTGLAEKHQATDVIHIVKKLFSRFQNIIRVYHGRIIETSGDGFYAAFGFDRDTKEAVTAAVQAGIAILNALDHLNEQTFEKSLRQRIDVGIGVHVGKVAVGNLHLGSKDHFVVMGYAVNVASRLQAATKEFNNNFIVSSAVFRIFNSPLLQGEAVKATLKGVSDPCEMHLIGKAYAA